ncbi:MAG: DUF3880 domain-containing protein, partial [Candidatus Methylomirabilis sp.]|nr:DUF3880 domain-containing protein [Deltaproteobacteria bacterium]
MSYFLKNTRLFEARFPDFRRLRKAPIPRNHITVVPSESGVPTIIAGGKTLHSRLDPIGEAQSFIASQTIERRQGVVMLGMGLGYHLNALVDRLDRNQALCVVEPDLGVFLAALDYNDFARVADHPNLYFILGGDSQTASDEIKRVWLRNGLRDLCTIIHWPSVRRAPDYYEAIQTSLRSLGAEEARRTHAYAKLREERLRVLFFDTGFLLQKECAKAMRALGHKVVFFRGEDGKGELREDFVDQFREAVLAYRPDVVFTINHKGFDRRGDLTHMLEVFELPLVSWFVDSPTVIHQGSEANVSPWVSAFTWERSYIEPLRRLGFQNVDYLPLAT